MSRKPAVLAVRVWGVGVLLADVWLLRFVARHGLAVWPEWYGSAAILALAANAGLLAVTATRGDDRPRSVAGWRWIAIATAVLAFAAGCWTRGLWLDEFSMAEIPDMHRVISVGVRCLLRGEFPYKTLHVPWSTFMVYQPGMLLPYVVPAAFDVDVRWTAVVTSALVPALWIAVFGARGPAALAAVAPVAAGWLFEAEQQTFAAQFHDAAWWPWAVGGSLCFLRARWIAAGVLWGCAAASRQYAAGVVILLALHLVRREGWRPARTFALTAAGVAALLYLPFVAVDWWRVLVVPLRTYHQVMVRVVIPNHPEWIRESLGWSWWLLPLPGYAGWILPLQVGVVGLYVAASTLWTRTRAGAVLAGGLALLTFNFLQDWPVWYLHCAPLLLIATACLDAICTSTERRQRD